jgi:hypothetical protein
MIIHRSLVMHAGWAQLSTWNKRTTSNNEQPLPPRLTFHPIWIWWPLRHNIPIRPMTVDVMVLDRHRPRVISAPLQKSSAFIPSKNPSQHSRQVGWRSTSTVFSTAAVFNTYTQAISLHFLPINFQSQSPNSRAQVVNQTIVVPC